MAFHGTTIAAARPAPSAAQPLAWPAAALAIGTLSAGLWLGIGWVVATLL
jgi:hypothetical protein